MLTYKKIDLLARCMLIAFTVGCSRAALADNTLTPVSLQLQWHHQFQFAGYYAALQQGYYRDVGLDVSILDGGYDASGHAVNPEEEVLFGRAQFGVTRTDLLVRHSEGLPLVVLANIMQHSPFVLLTLEKYQFSTLEAIGAERPVTLNIEGKDNQRIDAEAAAAMKKAGVDVGGLNNSPPTWVLEDLYSGKTELLPAYSTDEPYFVRRANYLPVEIKPEHYGIDFYGDLLFTSEKLIKNQPELVRKFRDASVKGWEYALENFEEIADLILREYKTRNSEYDKAFLMYEAAKVRELIEPDIIHIGYINPQRWLKVAETYKSLGLIDHYDIDQFLYRPTGVGIWSQYKYWIFSATILLVVGAGAICYFMFLTNKLRIEISRRQQSEEQLVLRANRDGLTGIDNRRAFEENLLKEFDRARRHSEPMSVLMIDLDNFKQINDRYGHLAGDDVLRSFVEVSGELLRKTDLFARYGGEEFVVLLPETNIPSAISLAERILRRNRENSVVHESTLIEYTLSIGVAGIADNDVSSDALLERSDEMLYKAKESGKNCVAYN